MDAFLGNLQVRRACVQDHLEGLVANGDRGVVSGLSFIGIRNYGSELALTGVGGIASSGSVRRCGDNVDAEG